MTKQKRQRISLAIGVGFAILLFAINAVPGKVRQQGMTPAQYQSVQVGMTMDQVQALAPQPCLTNPGFAPGSTQMVCQARGDRGATVTFLFGNDGLNPHADADGFATLYSKGSNGLR